MLRTVLRQISVRDAPRSGRQSTRVETCAAVEASIERSPMKSTRKRSAELGIPQTTMQDHMRKDLKVKCFRPMSVNELSDNDMENRMQACQLFLQRFPSVRNKKNVMFTDECAIYRSSRNRNVYFWSKENPHFYEEVENNPPHVNGDNDSFPIGIAFKYGQLSECCVQQAKDMFAAQGLSADNLFALPMKLPPDCPVVPTNPFYKCGRRCCPRQCSCAC